MNRVNFSDWQEMALKKDIEQIKKKLTSQEPVLFSLCWELVLALGSIIADHLFDTENAPEWIWFTVIALAVIPAAVILGVVVGKWICSIVSVKKGKFNVKDSVDIFDNQISYWVMLSNAYTDMLLEDINGTNSEKEFLYREGCYYNNKSMQAIYAMKSNFDKIFSMDPQKVKEDSLVDMERLFNILRVMKEQQDRLDATISEISSEGIKRQRELNEKYMDDLMKFVKDLNESNEKSRIKTFKWDEN
ncbi:hypothetical protein [Faecalibacterium prausnitzii]|uniref:hypothetical protein n=1 Tax=Faecalibacterium prausnitzii TaxID=853 RepID=UPI003A7F8DD1